jgi:septum formation protein
MGLPFNIMPAGVDEVYEKGMDPEEITKNLAVRKVERIEEVLQGRVPPWICGADTVISLDGEILGKPLDRNDAASMLWKLQGREHQVVTSVALFNGREKTVDCRSVVSSVTFTAFSEEEIEWYLNTGEWQEAAGSYKIQGLASCFISAIKGSYSGIVGLPMREFYVMLRDNGYPYGGV